MLKRTPSLHTWLTGCIDWNKRRKKKKSVELTNEGSYLPAMCYFAKRRFCTGNRSIRYLNIRFCYSNKVFFFTGWLTIKLWGGVSLSFSDGNSIISSNQHSTSMMAKARWHTNSSPQSPQYFTSHREHSPLLHRRRLGPCSILQVCPLNQGRGRRREESFRHFRLG